MTSRPARIVLLIVSLTTMTQAIVTRHDIDAVADDAEARRFAAVCKVLPDGEGVLIAPRWVLTAAHVATGAPQARLRVRFEGIDYRIAEVVAYPNWEPGRSDIALMRLAAPVPRVAPLDFRDAAVDEGAVVLLAGRGDFGDGRQGIAGNDGKLRIAENEVSRVESERLHIRLDAPGDGALPREGVSGPGDSGTPVLVERVGKLVVVGIGSVGSSPEGGAYGEYGSVDIFISTAHYRDWIDNNLAGASTRTGS